MVPLLAIASAFFYSLVIILTTVGLRYVSVLSALIIIEFSSVVAALALSIAVVPFDTYVTEATLYFIAAGALGPFIAHYLLVEGIDRVGSSIATAIIQTRPLYSAIGALMLLGESLSSFIILGMFFMIVGTAVISFEQSGGKIVKQWSRKDLVFPIMAGMCWGVAHVLRKMGLNVIPQPIVGVTIQNATALAFFSLVALVQREKRAVEFSNKSAWLALGVGGIISVLAQLLLYYALDFGEVVIVSPLTSLNSFFVLILAALFLRKLERVTWKIAAGTVFIFAGAVLLTITSYS